MNCPKDVGIYLNRSKNTRIVNNGIFNTAGIDVRFQSSSAHIVNNVMDGRVRQRNGGRAKHENNLMLGDRMFGGVTLSDLYKDPVNGDFDLRDPEKVVSRGLPVRNSGRDFCGNPRRTAAPDLGPMDYGGESNCKFFDIWRTRRNN